jgi:proline iminopeptidase
VHGRAAEQRSASVRIAEGTSPGGSRVIKKILKYVGIAILGLVVVALSSALLYREYLRHKVAKERAIRPPNGINSLERVRIGGIDQWIEVRGQNVNNPILLFIHGGPGIAFIPLAVSFQGPWETQFTVAQWDQRGAGKTYASNDRELQRQTMNVAQMEQDTVEVANYLRHRFAREKIFVVGHSWGSVLGLWLAHEHPELIYAFVGTGQLVNAQQNDEVGYHDALQQARSQGDLQAIRELESIAPFSPPPVMNTREASIARHWEEQLLGPPPGGPRFADVKRILLDVVSAPEYTLADDFGFIRGLSLSASTLGPQLPTINLDQLGSGFRVPIFFFEGRQDPYCRPSLIWDYSRRIGVPQNQFVWFDHAGHFPFFEEPQKFSDELVERVLPLAGDGQELK